ncbi:hypothetical protein ACWIG4_18205 [Streptomyces sp. NPDC002248]
MSNWKHQQMKHRAQRRRTKRCRFVLQTASGPVRCIFHLGHPPHGHTLSEDLSGAPVTAPRH